MRWTEGFIHERMRDFLRQQGWVLVAGEYPGGTDHELLPAQCSGPFHRPETRALIHTVTASAN